MSLRYLTAGESHGPSLTVIMDGIPAGLPLDASIIDTQLARRQTGFGSGGRMKIEKDRVKISGGVMGGKTIGSPIAMLVENADHINWKGKAVDPMTIPRPGHADLTGAVKYGYRDLRPSLERASARETTMRVAVGAVCKHFLSQFGILVGGYVRAIGGIEAILDGIKYENRIKAAEKDDIRCPDPKIAGQIRSRIREIIKNGDTLGGVIEILALNVPPGLGGFAQWDRRLDARLALAIMSVQAIKGIEIGDAFENASLLGTETHDAILLEKTKLKRSSNRAGGMEGGISNGKAIVLRAAMKPIATTITSQTTVDLSSGSEALTKYERSDYCPVPRAVPVLEAMTAFVLADALIEKLGGDSIDDMKIGFKSLRQMRLEDLVMNDQPNEWWK